MEQPLTPLPSPGSTPADRAAPRETARSDAYDVLIVMDHYLPGRASGGPITTIANLTARLGQELRFLIVTRTTELGGAPLPGVRAGERRRVNGADVLYLAPDAFTAAALQGLVRDFGIGTVYLNSFFSPTTVRFLLRQRVAPVPTRVILAPRGEFSAGALRLKALKKRTYLQAFERLGLREMVQVFQASSSFEARDILRALGPVQVAIAADLAAVQVPAPSADTPDRDLVFISRISPMKNLTYAIEVVQNLGRPVRFDIYGPMEDEAYWAECQALIRRSPPGVQITYRGPLGHEEVASTFARYAAFLLPTRGENFGHAILEALGSGCPVVISDATPWQDLEAAGVGWAHPLSEPGRFAASLLTLLTESPSDRHERRARCLAYAQRVSSNADVLDDNRRLLTDSEGNGA